MLSFSMDGKPTVNDELATDLSKHQQLTVGRLGMGGVLGMLVVDQQQYFVGQEQDFE